MAGPDDLDRALEVLLMVMNQCIGAPPQVLLAGPGVCRTERLCAGAGLCDCDSIFFSRRIRCMLLATNQEARDLGDLCVVRCAGEVS